jgi:hypothetical protein
MRQNGSSEVGIYVAHGNDGPYTERRFLVPSRYEDAPDWPGSAREALSYINQLNEPFVLYYVDCSGSTKAAQPRLLAAISAFTDHHIEAIKNGSKLT